MKTETKYRKGLKELIEERPLNEINVVMLCDYVKSNRQTFYYHYRDISDVIENIFLQERITSGRKPTSFSMVTHNVINYINSNYHFLSEVAKSFASEKLSEFLYSFYYKSLLSIYNKLDKNYSTIIRYISTISVKMKLVEHTYNINYVLDLTEDNMLKITDEQYIKDIFKDMRTSLK